LNSDESYLFDKKSADISISKLAEAMIGFANADGGVIAIGIKDRKLQGVLSQGNTKVNDFLQCGFLKCQPPVNYKQERISVIKSNGKSDEIILLHIEPSVDVVHKTEADAVFSRIGDETTKLNFEQRIGLEYSKGSRLYEEQLIEGCTFEDLDEEVLNRYKATLDFGGSYEELLLARRFVRHQNNELKFTVAAVLLFTKFPTAFIPSAKVRFFRYEGIEAQVGTSMNISKQKTFEGPLPKLIENSRAFISTQLREFTALDKNTGKFVSVPEYPPFAWQEGVINAIVHRAYNIHGDDIKIFMFDDRIEVHSPGKFLNIVTTENIKDTRYSRNPKVARVLTELGWVRELNEGVKRIYRDMEHYFLEDPIYKETNTNVVLILRNNILMRQKRKEERLSSLFSERWESLTPDEKLAIEIVFAQNSLKTKEFSEKLGKGLQATRRILNNLEGKSILEKIASSTTDPNSYYVLNFEEKLQ